jgi:hypothetical protein
MSNYRIFLICLYIIFLFGNCQQKNTLAQDESALVSELNELDAIPIIQERKPNEAKFLDIPEAPRSPDPYNPVIVLDILAARSKFRDVKLLDLYSKIKYVPVRFKEPVDSIWNRLEEFDFLVTPSNIIASSFTYGIAQFDLYGNFVNQVVKNDFYYTTIPGRSAVMISSEDHQKFKGAKGDVHAIGDILFYQYHDLTEKKGSWIQYNAAPGELSASTIDLDENTDYKPMGLQLNNFDIHNFRGAMSGLGANNIFPINEDDWAETKSKYSSSKSGSFMVSTNINGDTLTKFKDFDPVVNYSGGNYRSTDQVGDQYTFNNMPHVMQGLNDTIYMMVSANKLTPKYVLDFGKKGIQSPMEMMNPRFDLKEKFIIDQFIETNKYLFIIYTQDAPSPNSAKKGTLLYNACIYDKVSKELYHVYIDQLPYVPKGNSWPKFPLDYLINDYDQGPAFWPKKSTHDGKPITWIKGRILKEQMKNSTWKKDLFSIENMREDDYLLMIAQ